MSKNVKLWIGQYQHTFLWFDVDIGIVWMRFSDVNDVYSVNMDVYVCIDVDRGSNFHIFVY
jgi:hypothetical protein